MDAIAGNYTPGSAFEWYDLGCSFRKKGDFGNAVNAFARVLEIARGDCGGLSEQERRHIGELAEKASASIELIKDITGFVNADLMNP